MFIAIITYKKSMEEVNSLRPQHLEHLKKYFAAGKLLVTGRQNPLVGGIIISKTDKREEFESIMQVDPYVTSETVDYKIIEFIPNLYDDLLKSLFEK